MHKTDNLDDGYMGSGTILKRHQKKYGLENFEKEILHVFDNKEEMMAKEAELVNEEWVKDPFTYNLTVGGMGGGYHTKGMVTVRDKDGNCFNVSVNDERYLNGELPHASKGKVPVVDKNGNTFCVYNNDTRYISGELVFIGAGRKMSEQNKLRISEQNKDRNASGMNSWIGKHHTEDTKLLIKQKHATYGYQVGEKNSQYGTKWISNVETREEKKIKAVEPLPPGWKYGRLIGRPSGNTKKRDLIVKKCNKCGGDNCKFKEICKKSQMINTLIEFFGFDKNVLGTGLFYAEYDRVKQLIWDEYHVNMLSTLEITEKYNVTSSQRLDSIFKSLDIKKRTLSEALKNYTSK